MTKREYRAKEDKLFDGMIDSVVTPTEWKEQQKKLEELYYIGSNKELLEFHDDLPPKYSNVDRYNNKHFTDVGIIHIAKFLIEYPQYKENVAYITGLSDSTLFRYTRDFKQGHLVPPIVHTTTLNTLIEEAIAT